jgi:hypothetical protein
VGHVVTAHQANYLPYLGFFEKILQADHYVLVDDTQFVKRGPFGWIHRNRILSPNGPQWLTVPVKTHDRYEQLISEVIIDNSKNWSRKHLRAIELNYRKAPHFGDLFEDLKTIYNQDWEKLVDLSEAFILWGMKQLKLERPVTRSSSYHLSGKGSSYVLELAQKSGATTYLSGTHGKDYLDLDAFEQANMNVEFQNFECQPYPQIHGDGFTSHLCILDPLMHIGRDKTRQLLDD